MIRSPYTAYILKRNLKCIAIIAILFALLVFQTGMIAAKRHALVVGSVSSPLRATAAVAAVGTSAPMPNYAENAIALRHWNKHELAVRVTPSAGDNKTPAEVLDAAAQSAKIWNDKVGATVTLKVSGNADPDIEITFVAPGTLRGGAIGLTNVQFHCDDQSIGYASIRVNEKLPKDQLVQVLAHEMGHALGIQGHSDDRDDLMYPFAHLPAQITERDRNTFQMGYSQTASIGTVTTE